MGDVKEYKKKKTYFYRKHSHLLSNLLQNFHTGNKRTVQVRVQTSHSAQELQLSETYQGSNKSINLSARGKH